MNEDATLKQIDALCVRLEQLFPGWTRRPLDLLGRGMEFDVYGTDVPEYGAVALKVARTRWISNDNDPLTDVRQLLTQEAFLCQYVRRHHLPAPAPFQLCFNDDGPDFLVSERIDHREASSTSAIAGFLQALHTIPAPGFQCVALRDRPLESMVAHAIVARCRVIERITGESLPVPSPSSLERRLHWPAAGQQLLHMDPRIENFLCEGGRVRATVDWSNALIGDPLLELYRVSEYGLMDESFVERYRGLDSTSVPRIIELIYRAYTASMRAVLFTSEAPNEEQGARAVDRLRTLLTAIVAC
jgi:aminoglycoside phosphotransferase (APT) family kinase protein